MTKYIAVISLLGIIGFASGCGSDDDDDGTAGTGGVSGGSGSGGTSGGSGSGGTSGGSGSGGTAGTGGGGAGTGGGGGTGGTSSVDGVPGVPSNGVPGGSNYVYGYSDTVSTHNVTSPMAGTYCLDGNATIVLNNPTTMMPDYGAYYGAGLGIQFATTNMTGDVVTAGFDATGLATISFTLTTDTPSPIRVALVDVDTTVMMAGQQPAHEFFMVDAMNNPVPNVAGTITLTVAELSPPSWILMEPTPSYTAADLRLNSIKALQISVPTDVSAAHPYNFCVSNIQFLDAGGMSILPPEGTGGAGGAGGAGG